MATARFILKVIAIALLGYYAQLYFPWWSSAVVAFVVEALVGGRKVGVFFSGFLGLGALWGGLAAMIHSETNGILTEPVAQVLTLNSAWLLIAITALIGALMGGLSSMAGAQFRGLLARPKRKTGYYQG